MSATATDRLLDLDTAPEPPGINPKRTALLIAFWLGMGAIMTWAWDEAAMSPIKLWQDRGNMLDFLFGSVQVDGARAGGFFPPDFTRWQLFGELMLQTLAMALWGSVLAVVCAIPCGLLSASNIAPVWVVQPMRRLMDSCRAINELVFALVFVAAVGLGPMAGVLALWVHTTGTLAKLFSEAVEAIDPRPIEGIRATGAPGVIEVVYGVIPQVVPLWISYSMYRFEANVRSATVVGLVGAGGIGMALHESMRSFNYTTACAILIIIVVVVSLVDVISSNARKLLI